MKWYAKLMTAQCSSSGSVQVERVMIGGRGWLSERVSELSE